MGSIVWLSDKDPVDFFPPVQRALREPDGLLAAGGDLSPQRLIAAYRRGIFPWYSQGQPILWWSPDPRAILIPGELKVSRSLRKSLRNRGFQSGLDSAFEQVISRCADESLRPEGTWISAEMRSAYIQLHRMGIAHSTETWRDGRLVGGLYGVLLGRVFFGESMFSTESDASKAALVYLRDALISRNVGLIDCQMSTPHLMAMGARSMPREIFLERLRNEAAAPDQVGPWRVDSAPVDQPASRL